MSLAFLSLDLRSGSFQVFREQAIDGETLPLLTEEHLLNNMGLKLGPALKIRSQVGKLPISHTLKLSLAGIRLSRDMVY